MEDSVKIECPSCEANVFAIVKSVHDVTENSDPEKIQFLICPHCNTVMLGYTYLIQIGKNNWDWTDPYRLYPKPAKYIDSNIPHSVRRSLEEAEKCFRAIAYSASVVMCGKAIEAICIEYKTKNGMFVGLKELKDKEIIDGRLYEWSELLRKERNFSAHPTDVDFSKKDARDILDFAIAISEYVFVFTQKYEEYINRRSKEKIIKSK